MVSQLQMNYDPARAARDEGIARAADHADREVPSWGDKAFAQLVLICSRYRPGHEITGEAIRKIAEANGLPIPSEKRAWGSILVRAAKAGIIRRNGWATSETKEAHCRPISKWVIV